MQCNTWIKWIQVAMVTVIINACGGGASDGGRDQRVIMHMGIAYGVVKSPYTGKEWLDRNLGANQACTAYNHEECYGDYYQWGRNIDGHEKGTSSVATQATQISPVQKAIYGKFIKGHDDWAEAGLDDNGSVRIAHWNKLDGFNVCPAGFRVPTSREYRAELFADHSAEIDKDSAEKEGNSGDRRINAFKTFLKLPSAGIRAQTSASLKFQGERGELWCNSSTGISAHWISLDEDDASAQPFGNRAHGLSVRCIKE